MPSTHHVPVRKTARVVTRGTPGAPEWWVLLHGYGQTADAFLESASALASPDRFLIAPEALSRFYTDGMEAHESVGASWMTRRDRETEISDYLGYLETVLDHFRETAGEPEHLCVLGFSQGTATASRFVLLGDVTADRLVLWAGDVAHDLDPSSAADRLRAVDISLVVGSNDQYVTDERLQAALDRFDRLNVPVSVHRFNGGHRLDDDTLREILDF